MTNKERDEALLRILENGHDLISCKQNPDDEADIEYSLGRGCSMCLLAMVANRIE